MEELFSGYGWTVRLESASLPDGRIKKAARVHRADSVHILSFHADETILLLREYRPYYGEYIWMLPSGRVDKESDIVEAAQRELREETGYAAGKIELYFTARHSESIVMANHVFIARDLTMSPLPQDVDELIGVHTMHLPEALEKVLASPIVHALSALALLRYRHDHHR